ncbi:MAG: hypothetical protein ABI895_26295, partial [Deltaproteobacteria bacterium]
GNQCTNDSCSANGCQRPAVPNRTTCDPPSGTLETCTNGARQVTACGQLGCAPGSTTCNNCSGTGQCNGNQFTPCNNGRLGAPVNCDDGNQCTNDSCSANGCQRPAAPNRSQCVNGDIQTCNNGNFANQDCGANGCNAGSTSCNACAANTAPSCVNGQRRTCVNGQFQDAGCGGGQTCQGGACVTTQICRPGTFTACAGTTAFTRCNAAGTATNERVACDTGQSCDAAQGRCVATRVCTPNDVVACALGVQTVCNAAGTATFARPCTQANAVCAGLSCVAAFTGGGGARTRCDFPLTFLSCEGTTLRCLAGGEQMSTSQCPAGTACSGTGCQ